MFINKKLVNLSFLFFSYISYCGLNSFPVLSEEVYPGIFVMDTKSKWKIEVRDDSPDEKFGYVVCNGGYLGSPLIANEKKIVDRYLAKCASGHREAAYTKLPIIDLPSNYDETKVQNLAYKAEINGRNYYLCKGYLNSTNWCSAEGESKAQDLLNRLEGGQDISPDIQEMTASHQKGRDLVIQRNNQAQNLPINNLQTPSLNSLASKKAIKITQEELNALKTGEIQLQDLVSEREVVNLNNINLGNNNQAQNLPINNLQIPSLNSLASKKAIKITQEELNALKTGEIQLQDLVSEREVVNLNNINLGNNNQAQNINEMPALKIQPVQVLPVEPRVQAQRVQPNYAQSQSVQSMPSIQITQNDYTALQNGSLSAQQLVQNYLPSQVPQMQQMPQMQNYAPPVQVQAIQPTNYYAQSQPIQLMPLAGEQVQTIQITQNDYNALQNGSLSAQQLVQNYLPSQVPQMQQMPQMQNYAPVQAIQPNYAQSQYNNSGFYYGNR